MKKNHYLHRLFSMMLILPLIVGLMVHIGPPPIVTEAASHVHDASCYGPGVAKHQHYTNNAKTSKSTAASTSSSGGCYTIKKTTTTGGKRQMCYDYSSVRIWVHDNSTFVSYDCGCCANLGCSAYAHAFDNNNDYTETDTYKVTRQYCAHCGAVKYNSEFYASYVCGTCGGSPNHGFSGGSMYTPPAVTTTVYEPSCGKSTSVFYTNNGDGEEAVCICDKAVVTIQPVTPSQTFTYGSGTVDARVNVKFKDGHTETVTANVSNYVPSNFNTWQTITLTYGAYNAPSEIGTITAGGKSCTAQVYILGTKMFSVSSSDPASGDPSFAVEDNASVRKSGDIIIGKVLTLNKNPYPGYMFTGWTDTAGNTVSSVTAPVALTADTAATSQLTMPAYDYSLIGHYDGKPVTITYDYNGGKLGGQSSSTATKKYNTVYGAMPEPKLDGYYFLGYYLSTDATQKIISKYDLIRTGDNHTLVAKWTEKVPAYFIAEYDDYFPTLANGYLKGYMAYNSDSLPLSWYMEETSYNNGTGMNIISGSTIIKYSYVFNGNTILKPRNNYIIYGRWKPKTFNVTFVCGDNVYLNRTPITGAGGVAVTYNTCTAKGGYTSNGAVKKVTYDMPFGKFPTPVKLKADGTVDNTVFLVWSTNPGGLDVDPDSIVTPDMIVDLDDDITLYAVVGTDAAVTVSLNANGGTHNAAFTSGSLSSYYNATSKLVTFTKHTGETYSPFLGYVPTRAGHTFKGWKYNVNSATAKAYTDNDTVTISANHTLSAQWEHYVIYDVNTVDYYKNTVPNVEGYDWFGQTTKHVFLNNDSAAQAVHDNTFTRPGYKFIGWNTKADGTGTWYSSVADLSECKVPTANTTVSATQTMTLYAQWDSALPMTFDYRGGEYADAKTYSVVNYYNKTISATANVPVKDGYAFVGYYTGIKGTGEKVYDADGNYCYNNAGKTLYDGRVKLCNDNFTSTGETSDSNLASYISVTWPEIDRLYACWKFVGTNGLNGNINIDLMFTNEDYDVNEGIPSTEKVRVIGTIPKYIVSVLSDEGDPIYFDLTTPVTIQIESNFGTEEVEYLIFPELIRLSKEEYNKVKTIGKRFDDTPMSLPSRFVYAQNDGTLALYRVDELTARAYSRVSGQKSDMCFTTNLADLCIYRSISMGSDVGIVSIADASLAETIDVAYSAINSPIPMVATAKNDTYYAEYEIVLNDGTVLYYDCDEDIIKIHTPVAINANNSIADKDIQFSRSLLTEITVKADNNGTHRNIQGFGARAYVNSITAKKLIKDLTLKSNIFATPLTTGNVIAFPFDVWEKESGKYFEAGTSIVIGTGTVKFVVTPDTATSADYKYFMESVAVNAETGNRTAFSATLRYNAATNTWSNAPTQAGHYVNLNPTQYAAYDMYNISVTSSADNVLTYFKNYEVDNAPGVPRSSAGWLNRTGKYLYWGEEFYFSIDTAGFYGKWNDAEQYISETAKITVVPSYYTMDGAPVTLYTYDTLNHKLYSYADRKTVAETKLVDAIKTLNNPLNHLGISADLTGQSTTVLGTSVYNIGSRAYLDTINMNINSRLINALSDDEKSVIGKYTVSKNQDKTLYLDKDENGIKDAFDAMWTTWYGSFAIPENAVAVKTLPAGGEHQLLSDLIYGNQVDYIVTDPIKVTFDVIVTDESGMVITLYDAVKFNRGDEPIIYNPKDLVSSHTDIIFVK